MEFRKALLNPFQIRQPIQAVDAMEGAVDAMAAAVLCGPPEGYQPPLAPVRQCIPVDTKSLADFR